MSQIAGRLVRIAIAFVLVLTASFPVQAETVKPYRLDNGLTVIQRPLPTAKDIAVVVLFNMGSDHDTTGRSGRAHLLEHLYCTTAAGSKPSRSAEQILRDHPAGSNAQTGSDYTVFASVVRADELAGELIDAAARMGDLRITDTDLAREVPRLRRELNHMFGQMPSLAGLNHVRLRLHPITDSGQFSEYGYPDHIKSIGLDELRQFWRDYYKPRNAILSIAGPLDLAETRRLVQQHFGSIPVGKSPPEKPTRPKAKTGTTERIVVKPLMPGATGVVSIGYTAPRPGNKDYAPFLLVVSRLWAASAGDFRPGEVQPVYFPVLDDTTTVAIQASLPSDDAAETMIARLEERLQAALAPKIEPQDKAQLASMMLMLGAADLPDDLWAMNVYGLAFSAGRQHQLKIDGPRLRRAIERLSGADVRRVAKSIFSPEKRVVQIVDVKR